MCVHVCVCECVFVVYGVCASMGVYMCPCVYPCV